MIRLFPAGLLTLAASAVLLIGAVEASGPNDAASARHSNNKKNVGADVAKNVGIDFKKGSGSVLDVAKKGSVGIDFNKKGVGGIDLLNKKGVSGIDLINNKKGVGGIDLLNKKGNIGIDLNKKGVGGIDLNKKGNGGVDNAKKGKGGVDVGKKGPGGVDPFKKGKAPVQNDLYCKPYCKPIGQPWCGWWGGWCGGWGGAWGGGWNCHPWWWNNCGTWCPPGGGWFGGWYPVMGETIIIETPVYNPGYGPMPGPIVDPGFNPGPLPGPVMDPGAGPGPGPGAGPGPAGDPAIGGEPPAGPAAEMKVQTKRFLKVKNESGEKLMVFVQYVVKTEDGDAMWFPGEAGSDKALTFVMEPGQEMLVENNGKKMASSVARIWGVSEKGSFLHFRTNDLVLVPELDQAGQHVYPAEDVRTFTFVFPRPE